MPTTTSSTGTPAPSGTSGAPAVVRAQWAGARRFDVGRPGGRVVRIDGNGETGPSPVDALLGALATCAATDVVDILAKRRTPVSTLELEVIGTRSDGTPRRLTRAVLRFRITGEGIDRAQAERAIDLSITKYCSVRDSLDPAIPVEWTLDLSDTPMLRTSG